MSMEDRADPVALFREREEKRAANNPNANVDERVEQDIIRQVRDVKGTLEQKQSLYDQLSPETQRSTPSPTQGLDRDQLQKYKDELMDSMLRDPNEETQNKIRNVEGQLERQHGVEPLHKRLGKDDPQLLNSRREKLVSKMLAEPNETTQTEIRDIDEKLKQINSPKPTVSQEQKVAAQELNKDDLPLPEWDLFDEDKEEFENGLETAKKEGLMDDVSSEEVLDQEPVDRRHRNVQQQVLNSQQNTVLETIARHDAQNESRSRFVSDTDADEFWKKEQDTASQKTIKKRWSRLWGFFNRTSKE